MDQRPSLGFFLKGLAGLVILLGVTLLMTPSPELNALRAFIGVGIALVCVKMLFRHFGIDWPRRRG
jgi:hypothetical protein